MKPTWADLFPISRMNIAADIIFQRGVTGQVDNCFYEATQSDVEATNDYMKAFQRTSSTRDATLICVLDVNLQRDRLTVEELSKITEFRMHPPVYGPAELNSHMGRKCAS